MGSYTSKSSGNLISGLEINFRLPVPDITNLIVIASLVFSSLLLIDEEILNSPTPPEKSAGLPAGSGFTFIAILGVEIDFFISMTLLHQIVQAYRLSSGIEQDQYIVFLIVAGRERTDDKLSYSNYVPDNVPESISHL